MNYYNPPRNYTFAVSQSHHDDDPTPLTFSVFERDMDARNRVMVVIPEKAGCMMHETKNRFDACSPNTPVAPANSDHRTAIGERFLETFTKNTGVCFFLAAGGGCACYST